MRARSSEKAPSGNCSWPSATLGARAPVGVVGWRKLQRAVSSVPLKSSELAGRQLEPATTVNATCWTAEVLFARSVAR